VAVSYLKVETKVSADQEDSVLEHGGRVFA